MIEAMVNYSNEKQEEGGRAPSLGADLLKLVIDSLIELNGIVSHWDTIRDAPQTSL